MQEEAFDLYFKKEEQNVTGKKLKDNFTNKHKERGHLKNGK